MNKKRVLVFPCGSEIGLEVYNSVKDSTYFELFGLSSIDDHGKFVYENYIQEIGFITEKDFISKLNDIILKYKIDIVYPTMDSVIAFLKRNEKIISVPVLGSNLDTALICESKLLTYGCLQDVVRCPRMYKANEYLDDFPMFVKPIIGYGSRNTFKVTQSSQIVDLDFKNNLLLEFLPGEEYTIDCFTDMDGELKFIGPRKRAKIVNGISVSTASNDEIINEFYPIAEKINSRIKFTGSWFFQMKRNINNELTLLEVACRFAGSSSVHRIRGVNFALSNLFIHFGFKIDFIINQFNVELNRALNSSYKIDISYDCVYIDFDDTILINQQINTDSIAFLYQCLNEKIKLILITKHSKSINETLEKYKLNQIFDYIVHLKNNDEKYKHITLDNKPIFIDDSFSERKKVFDKFKIPVFSVDAIPSLIR